MVTQTEEDENSQCRFVILPRVFWKLGQVGFPQNPLIVIAVKVMVKLKNLYRLKDGLGPCFEDANIIQQLPLHGEF